MDITKIREILISLARGIDPISGDSLAKDSPVHNVDISRALFYGAKLLGEHLSD